MIGRVAARVKWLVASSLLLAAAISIALAFRERATADFLTLLASEALSAEANGQMREKASWYYTAFWFDVALAAPLVLIAIGVFLRARSSWLGSAALVGAFAGGSSIRVLLADQIPEVRGFPVGVFAVALTAVAGVAVVGATFGLRRNRAD